MHPGACEAQPGQKLGHCPPAPPPASRASAFGNGFRAVAPGCGTAVPKGAHVGEECARAGTCAEARAELLALIGLPLALPAAMPGEQEDLDKKERAGEPTTILVRDSDTQSAWAGL